jgi:glycerol uptake facilitator-like aquaporin
MSTSTASIWQRAVACLAVLLYSGAAMLYLHVSGAACSMSTSRAQQLQAYAALIAVYLSSTAAACASGHVAVTSLNPALPLGSYQ